MSRVRCAVALALVALAAVSALVVPGVAAGDELSDKRAEADRIAARVAELNELIEVEAEAYNAARIELEGIQASIADAQAKVASTNAELAARRAEVQAYAVGAYLRGGDGFDVPAILDRDVDEMGQVRSYLSAATGNRQQLIDGLRAAEDDLAVQIEQLEAKQGEAQAAAAELAERQRRAEAAAAEQKQLLSQVQGELAELVRQEQERLAAAARAAAEARAREAAARPTTPKPSGGSQPAPAPAPAPTGGAATAVATAKAQIGDPYEWGAEGPDSFDCSGLTLYAWQSAGVSLPHNSSMQYNATLHVPLAEVQPGDLVFYGSPIHHVALYVGGGRIVHAPHAGDYVREDSIYYWDDIKPMVGRVTG